MFKLIATFIMIASLFLVAGCVKKKSDSGKDQVVPVDQPTVDVRYQGQQNGCIQDYDPLFCGPEYKPKGE